MISLLSILSILHYIIILSKIKLIEQTFNREGFLYLAYNEKRANCVHVKKICHALHYLLDNIFIRFGSKLYRQRTSASLNE